MKKLLAISLAMLFVIACAAPGIADAMRPERALFKIATPTFDCEHDFNGWSYVAGANSLVKEAGVVKLKDVEIYVKTDPNTTYYLVDPENSKPEFRPRYYQHTKYNVGETKMEPGNYDEVLIEKAE